ELWSVGEELEQMDSLGCEGYLDDAIRDKIKTMEMRRRKILLDREEQWRIKSRAICVEIC
ncbi:hypothetical protein, partial [Bacteroides uniformis]|uniref:hypothetical protein n=1 Tax=Bacteroides uniformis TaxID=820 RepID=UPI001AA15FAB